MQHSFKQKKQTNKNTFPNKKYKINKQQIKQNPSKNNQKILKKVSK